jgi:hypothetical protein
VVAIDRLFNLFASYDRLSDVFKDESVECNLVLDPESFLYAHYLLIVLGKLNVSSASRMYDRSGGRDISGTIYRLMQDMLRRMINWSIFRLRKNTGLVHVGLALARRFETEWVALVGEFADDLAIKNGNPDVDEDIASMLSKPGHPVSVAQWESGDRTFDPYRPIDITSGLRNLTELASTAGSRYVAADFPERFHKILLTGRLQFVSANGSLGRPIHSDCPGFNTFGEFCSFFVQEQAIFEARKDSYAREDVVSIKSNVFDLLG